MVMFLSLDLLEDRSFFSFSAFFRFFFSWVESEGLPGHEDSSEELVPKRTAYTYLRFLQFSYK